MLAHEAWIGDQRSPSGRKIEGQGDLHLSGPEKTLRGRVTGPQDGWCLVVTSSAVDQKSLRRRVPQNR